jgi:hypothetical protein
MKNMWESRYDYELSWNLAELAEKVGFGDADRINETTIHGLHRWLIEEKKVYVMVDVVPTFSTIDNVMFSWTVKWDSNGETMNKCESFYYDSSYYAALEKGLKEALDMLIRGEIKYEHRS